MLIGVVGKPSSGKSTFFSAATMVEAEIANYPFTTIEPNKGIGFVRIECIDTEFKVQCNPRTGYCKNGIRFVPVELIDVAGLVPGASTGKGKGNAFLSDLSRADVLVHVVDASGSINENGEPVPQGSYNPCKDIEFLEQEIGLWFFGIVEKNWAKVSKQPLESKQKVLDALLGVLSGLAVRQAQIETALKNTELLEKKLGQWDSEDKKEFAFELRKISKPIVIAANKADIPVAEQKIKEMKEKFPDYEIIACSGFAELALKKAAKQGLIEYEPGAKEFKKIKELNEKQEKILDAIKEVLEKNGSSGIQEVLEKSVFDVLKYIAVFPAGTKKLEDSEGNTLPDVFLIPPDSTSLDFAFKLHTTMGKGFIRAIDVKTKKMVGKDHKLKHRDAIEIIFKE